jgi:hypothetical protein
LNYFCFTVVESVDVVFCEEEDESGLEESDFTSLLLELLVDSVVVVGAGAAAGGASTTVVVEGGFVGGDCWHPVNVRPKAVRAEAANSLCEYGFMCLNLFLSCTC